MAGLSLPELCFCHHEETEECLLEKRDGRLGESTVPTLEENPVMHHIGCFKSPKVDERGRDATCLVWAGWRCKTTHAFINRMLKMTEEGEDVRTMMRCQIVGCPPIDGFQESHSCGAGRNGCIGDHCGVTSGVNSHWDRENPPEMIRESPFDNQSRNRCHIYGKARENDGMTNPINGECVGHGDGTEPCVQV
jgi:hypothetical protein